MPTVRVRPRHPVTGSPMIGERVTVRYTQIVFGSDMSTVARSSYLNTNASGYADFVLDSSLHTNPANVQVTFTWNGVSGLLATVPDTEGPHTDGALHWWELEEIIDGGQLTPVPVVAGVQSVTGASVDNTDPRNPVVTGGGGSGTVTSVAGVDPVSGDVPEAGLASALAGAFDAAGAASTAQAAAIAAAATDATTKANNAGAAAIAAADSYTDGKIAAEVARANGAYDALGAAAAAQAAAIAASQPLDSDLTAIAALATTTFGRALLTQADAAATRTTLGLGTAATQASTAFDASGAAAAAQAASQPLDSDLTAIAALTTTSFGRSFLALTDAAAGRTLLGLGTLATQSGTFSGTSSGTNTGDQDLSALAPLASPALTGNPTAPTQTAGNNSTRLATTAYVDSATYTSADKLYLAANYR